MRAFEGVMFQRFLFAGKAFAQFFRIIVTQFVQRKRNAIKEPERFIDRLRRVGKQSRHFRCIFEIAFRIGVQQCRAGLCNRYMLANAGHRIGQRPALRRMHQNVIDGKQRQTGFLRKRNPPTKARAHMPVVGHARSQPDAPRRQRGEAGEKTGLRAVVVHDDELQAGLECGQVLEKQMALAFLRAQIAAR